MAGGTGLHIIGKPSSLLIVTIFFHFSFEGLPSQSPPNLTFWGRGDGVTCPKAQGNLGNS